MAAEVFPLKEAQMHKSRLGNVVIDPQGRMGGDASSDRP
jgi:hypothetical protein